MLLNIVVMNKSILDLWRSILDIDSKKKKKKKKKKKGLQLVL